LIWPLTSLKFVHLALRSKRFDTPDLVHYISVVYVMYVLSCFIYEVV